MRVLFDIATLGEGYNSSTPKAGVVRVVENLVKELVMQKKCELKLCGSRGIDETISSLRYYDSITFFSSVEFSRPVFFRDRIRVRDKRKDEIDVIIKQAEKHLLEKVATRLILRASNLSEELLQFFVPGFINPKDISRTDIYHSPFYAIPEQIRKAKKTSIFLTSHDIIALIHPQFFFPSIINAVKEIVDSITPDTWVLCVSESTRNDLLNYLGNRINPDRAIVTHLATSDLFYIDTDETRALDIRMKYHIPNGPYVLSLCTLEPRKNIDQAIKAFSALVQQQNIDDVNLVLVGGNGWLSDKIFRQIELTPALKNRIIVTGYVADEDLSAIYSNALLFIYPSFYEGFGLPPLEAMKCGTPVITSNTSSLPEVVGTAGILIDPNDLDSICQAMFSVYANPSYREQLIWNSIDQAKKFSWDKCAEETVAAYKKSLA